MRTKVANFSTVDAYFAVAMTPTAGDKTLPADNSDIVTGGAMTFRDTSPGSQEDRHRHSPKANSKSTGRRSANLESIVSMIACCRWWHERF